MLNDLENRISWIVHAWKAAQASGKMDVWTKLWYMLYGAEMTLVNSPNKEEELIENIKFLRDLASTIAIEVGLSDLF